MAMRRIGRVVSLARFPVKSMRAEPRQELELGWNGVLGDRQYAFVRQDATTGFPWLTGRELPALVLHGAAYAEPEHPYTAEVRVTAPDGTATALRDPALVARLSDAAKHPAGLMRLNRGAYDSMPLSVISTRTLARLGEAHGAVLDAARFRSNIVVALDDDGPDELAWQGAVGFGATAVLRADRPIPRCKMITIDPHTAAIDRGVLRTVNHGFSNHAGLYATPVTLGRIAVGDAVCVN
jgi:uncharacterized protein YcbX